MNIYVSNLSFKLESEALEDLFKQYGEVTSARIIRDNYSGRSRGFGFVEMSSDDEANNAISALNGKDIDGRPLNVNEARPKPEGERGGSGRPPRSNDRGGNGGGGGGRGGNGGGGGGFRDRY